MNLPSSTYRLQLHHQFTFKHVKQILDYLHALGVSTIYASPIFSSVTGSMHGYDVANPHAIDPEIGTELQLKDIAEDLHKKNMDWLQDIVPNHMAFDESNEWLMDVLERGEASEYAAYFDIDWNHTDPELKGRLVIPFLGNELTECIEKKELKLGFNEAGFQIEYADNRWPVSISAYRLLLTTIKDADTTLGKETVDEIEQRLIDLEEQARSGISKREWQALKDAFITHLSNREKVKKAIERNIEYVSNDIGLLEELLDLQYYLLAYWRITEKKINYRRFFTVNSLICLRMEEPNVFEDYHRYIYALYSKNYLQGLRVDHIDGLSDPPAYIDRLRKLVGKECYVVAEKILAPNEELPVNWKLEGTSGYEFLSHASRLLTNVEGARKLVEYYKNNIAGKKSYEDIVFEKKLFMLRTNMRGELDNLVNYLHQLELWPQEKGLATNAKEALAIFMAAFPIYRLYPESFPVEHVELAEQAFQMALIKKPDHQDALKWIRSLFEARACSIAESSARILFLKRLMQFTGPLAAKGVEDTVFYYYNPLISHNEVGDEPGKLAIGSKTFHRQMLKRQEKTPFSLNATSTHDTKRGEDARMRINVLSEMSTEWITAVEQWMKENISLKKMLDGKYVPGINEEYFIYQSMIGGFPATLDPVEEDVSRLKEYVRKFLREQKIYTDWTEPDESYEEACFSFIDRLFDRKKKFFASFTSLLQKVISYAAIYSLSQSLLKITAPGIPDIYQGTELWDLSYVDPDNRRLVDYQIRMNFLDIIRNKESDRKKLLCYLADNRYEGVEKMFVLYTALHFRKNHSSLFHYGEYLPLTIPGGENDILAFARKWKQDYAITVIPLDLVNKMKPGNRLPKKEVWNKLEIQLPDGFPDRWENVFTHEQYDTGDSLSVGGIFSNFPVALLKPYAS